MIFPFFSHPDYTVGAGFSPARRRFRRSRTAGFRPSPPVWNFTNPQSFRNRLFDRRARLDFVFFRLPLICSRRSIRRFPFLFFIAQTGFRPKDTVRREVCGTRRTAGRFAAERGARPPPYFVYGKGAQRRYPVKRSPNKPLNALRRSGACGPCVRRALRRADSNYSMISATTPDPTVLPPSRIAKRRPFSIAMGVISSTVMLTLSPGRHISTSLGSSMVPVTSVVLK